MSDASKQNLSLATIAACCVVLVPCVIWGTQSYDGILETQKQLLQGQQESRDAYITLARKVDGQDLRLAQLQQSVNERSPRKSN